MIETPADYRSFVFCKANKTPVSSSFALGFRSLFFAKQTNPSQFELCSRVPEFCFLQSNQNPSQFELYSRVPEFCFFAKQIFFWGVTRKGSGYPLQVLALPSSGCGLFTSILHATYQTPNILFTL